MLHGAYSVVKRWLCSDTPETPEFIADVILNLARRLCS
ncbi:MAG: TetR family transcriptional regulator C-terminal domain-containing protein [Oscillospiraceae bacterium]|nr:TetR family transcriptional regulator C-terminal domain-containing protein [Oscillospiraceae bacterium]